MDDRVQFVTPLPPLPTGIAQYSRDLLQGLDGRWPLDVVGESGSHSDPGLGFSMRNRYRRGRPTIYQIGNSGFHRQAYAHGLREPGILVLHDVVLHHGRRGELLRSRGGADYSRLLRERYGDAGDRIVADLRRGRQIDDVRAFPLSEDYIERARLTVVHSQYARDLVLAIVPDAEVAVVPMGIPLPSLIEPGVARRVLGLPEDAYIAASITHVNPFKRIPVVLRAMRRVVSEDPDALLVIAGSVSPGMNLHRLIRSLGLERNVRVLGYVTDNDARLVARAADVCINLRYPSAGETSASLLRLLGAGRPVLVTDDVPMAEYPSDAVLPVPIDRYEDEMIADLLLMLSRETTTRDLAGGAARTFVERQHSLATMIAGYRLAIQRAFEIEMPVVESIQLEEAAPRITIVEQPDLPFSALDGILADKLVELRLAGHHVTIQSVANATTSLGLDTFQSAMKGRKADGSDATNQ